MGTKKHKEPKYSYNYIKFYLKIQYAGDLEDCGLVKDTRSLDKIFEEGDSEFKIHRLLQKPLEELVLFCDRRGVQIHSEGDILVQEGETPKKEDKRFIYLVGATVVNINYLHEERAITVDLKCEVNHYSDDLVKSIATRKGFKRAIC